MAGTTLTLTGASAGAAAVTVTASDEHGAAADDTFRVTVVALNHAPAVATPLSDQALELAQTRQVDISAAFTDADDDALNYTATLGDESIATATSGECRPDPDRRRSRRDNGDRDRNGWNRRRSK